MSEWVRILGIDPGSRITGFGVIDSNGPQTRLVASGCIAVDAESFTERLRIIFDRVSAVVSEHRPGEAAFEKVFVHRNADSALKLGQARAAAICATFSAGVAIHEYATRAVKQAVVGLGGAEKGQVQHMVRALLRLPVLPAADEADALAVAICHAHGRALAGRLAAGSGLRVIRR